MGVVLLIAAIAPAGAGGYGDLHPARIMEDASNRQAQAQNSIANETHTLGKACQAQALGELYHTLLGRCRKMLATQIAVHKATRALHRTIEAYPDKKPRPEDAKAALRLSGDVTGMIMDTTYIIDLLAAEGAADAFREFFGELRDQLKSLEQHLNIADVGVTAQAIEQDIIDDLQEMIMSGKR